jgi:hypothetical protein
MKRLSLVMALATALLAGSVHAAHAATTLVVDDDGFGVPGDCNDPTATYSTIQAAVNAAASGDTVQVCPGTYVESVSVTTDDVTLLGAKAGVDARSNRGPGESIVNPPSGQVGVSLAANDLTLDGFQVSLAVGNSGVYTSALSSGYSVVNNIIDHSMFGLYLNTGASTSNLVRHNRFTENNQAGPAGGNGIYSDQGLQNVSIEQNKFTGHQNAGILIAYAAQPTDDISIDGNKSKNDTSFANVFSGTNLEITDNTTTDTDNSDDATQGSAIRLEGVDGVLVQGNTIKNAPYSGIAVRDSEYGQDPTADVTIDQNSVTGSENDGIDVTASTSGVVTATANVLKKNENDGIEMGSTTKNNHLISNKAKQNVIWDCQDHSLGAHTSGTANFWITNIGNSSDPAGLCT